MLYCLKNNIKLRKKYCLINNNRQHKVRKTTVWTTTLPSQPPVTTITTLPTTTTTTPTTTSWRILKLGLIKVFFSSRVCWMQSISQKWLVTFTLLTSSSKEGCVQSGKTNFLFRQKNVKFDSRENNSSNSSNNNRETTPEQKLYVIMKVH